MEFSNIRILVAGDVMLDHYISGKASRISPEAPVPILNKERSWTVPGGAANVARGLAKLGCHVRLLGLAAQDGAGETLRKEVSAEGISAAFVTGKNRPTTCKTRIMASGQQLLRVDEEFVRKPELEERIALRHHLEDMIDGCDALILSDYAKGALLNDKTGVSLCQEAIKLARQKNIPVLIDPKGTDWDRYKGAQCITPNLAEFKQICQVLGKGDISRNYALHAENIIRQFNLDRLLLTKGRDGMTLFEPDKKAAVIRATAREVADVSGAGDSVLAVLTACVAKGMSWLESARIANIAAGIAVGKLGTAPVNIHELNNALAEKTSKAKIFSFNELMEQIKDWRNDGLRIVFTNGCFDLVHPGHIHVLKESSKMGDRLIVGLNTDNSVKRLKGTERPIQDENSRALVLSSLNMVDAVVLFNEDTPENLIKAIKPDVLVKGGDYQSNNIVGADFVQNYGGEVRIVKLIDGCSTTNLVKLIKGS